MTTNSTTNEWSPRGLYDIYRITIKVRDKICGGVPRNPDVLESAIKARTGHDDAITAKQIEEAEAALPKLTEFENIVEQQVQKSWNGFLSDPERGLFIWARQAKALFKECATMLRVTVEKMGSKQILQHGFEIKAPTAPEDRLFLAADEGGTPILNPHGFDEGPIHVQTPQGPRTAIKRVDFVEGCYLTFEVWVLSTHATEKRHVGEGEVREMLKFGQENGLGADRSQGRGKFDVVGFEVVQKAGRVKDKEEKPVANKPKKDKKDEASSTPS